MSQALKEDSQSYEKEVTLSWDNIEVGQPHEELKWENTPIRREIDVIIDSDASLAGWGAAHLDQSTGGWWSTEEAECT